MTKPLRMQMFRTSHKRKTIFVCSCIFENNLLNESIMANTEDEASLLFFEKHSIKPKEIIGPFYKKRETITNTNLIKFSNQTKKAIYNDWIVDAFLLSEPENHAYLIFLKRTDNKKVSSPKGTIIVPISDLRFNAQ